MPRSTSYQTCDFELSGMELVGLGTEDKGVVKSAKDIKSSRIVSAVGDEVTKAVGVTGLGNGSNGSTCRLAVPGSIAERIVDQFIISPLLSSTSFQHILAPIFSSTPAHRALISLDFPGKDCLSASSR